MMPMRVPRSSASSTSGSVMHSVGRLVSRLTWVIPSPIEVQVSSSIAAPACSASRT